MIYPSNRKFFSQNYPFFKAKNYRHIHLHPYHTIDGVKVLNYICFIGHDKDLFFKKNLLSLFNENFSLMQISARKIAKSGWLDFSSEDLNDNYAFTFIDCECVNTIRLDRCVLVFSENTDTVPEEIAGKHIVGIVPSRNNSVIEQLIQRRIPVITCGLSQKDTVTYSSRTDDELVVSLQRSVKRSDHVTIEPFEMPFALTPESDVYAILAFFAVCIECGIYDNGLSS